ncbi:hypothetical protein IA539_02815 [Gordonia sp. zg691]|uniref:hypothetical protein n=1 Tax=Gordonia jinghuaiqii TaxID=2758710 RepID=UPI0016623FAE|nr:hypothetical protein [Gordonia jinghuaiqii]MBD0860144.1 hypothetical protein [Gordonia jinghuaiqii]
MTPDILATSAIDQLIAIPIVREAGGSGLIFDRRSCRNGKVKRIFDDRRTAVTTAWETRWRATRILDG